MNFVTILVYTDLALEEALNYCRNPQFALQEQPWCYVESNGTFIKEECSIPYCGMYLN